MSEFTIAILLVALLGAAAQDSMTEGKAVARVRQTPASRYDPALPNQTFENWLNQVVGPQSGVSWRLGECIEQAETAPEVEQGIQACVEATAILPDDRKVVAQIHVGSFKQGLAPTTRFHFAVVENDGQLQSVRRLNDLPQLLREPLSAKRSLEVKKMNVVSLPQIKFNGALQLHYASEPELFSPPEITFDETENEPPPPMAAPAPRVSKGLSAGSALTKVAPIYPPMAKQMKVSGAVQVAITIDENGRVIEAKAISGPPMLQAAAEEAARRWVFRPTRVDGNSMKQQDILTFNFGRPE
jgi:TonB family protein